eukprot:gene2991-biopygen102
MDLGDLRTESGKAGTGGSVGEDWSSYWGNGQNQNRSGGSLWGNWRGFQTPASFHSGSARPRPAQFPRRPGLSDRPEPRCRGGGEAEAERQPARSERERNLAGRNGGLRECPEGIPASARKPGPTPGTQALGTPGPLGHRGPWDTGALRARAGAGAGCFAGFAAGLPSRPVRPPCLRRVSAAAPPRAARRPFPRAQLVALIERAARRAKGGVSCLGARRGELPRNKEGRVADRSDGRSSGCPSPANSPPPYLGASVIFPDNKH